MKRVIAVVIAFLMFIPIMSHAEGINEYSFHEGALSLCATDCWDIRENDSVEWVNEDSLCARAFHGYDGDLRIDMFFVYTEEYYGEDEPDLTEDDVIELVAPKYFMTDTQYEDVTLVKGEFIDVDRQKYHKIRLVDDYSDCDHVAYIAKVDSETYAMFTVRCDGLTDEQIEKAEEVLKTIGDVACGQYMVEAYDIMGSPGIDGFDMILNEVFGPRENGDFGDYIVGIVGIVIGIIILAIFIAARKNNKKRDNESGMDGRLVEHTKAYASSDSYERSIKTMLESGVITKKEYKELLRKHRG